MCFRPASVALIRSAGQKTRRGMGIDPLKLDELTRIGRTRKKGQANQACPFISKTVATELRNEPVLVW